jgi:hypothetical protein
MADADFREASTRREQIAVAFKHLRVFHDKSRLNFDEIGRFFGVGGSVIDTQEKRKSHQEARDSGRPSLLPPEVLTWMENLVVTRLNEHRPITYPELLDMLQYAHNIVISGNTLRHIVRRMANIKTIIGVPMESERVHVDPAAIDAWFDDLERRVHAIPRGFVFNVDEAGCSEQGDKREVTVLVPRDYARPSIEVPFDRHSKRSTLTACIAADGYRMKPFIIVDRVTMESEMTYYGYDQSNVVISSQPNAFMTTKLFELWGSKVFFPTVQARREALGYDGRALLLMVLAPIIPSASSRSVTKRTSRYYSSFLIRPIRRNLLILSHSPCSSSDSRSQNSIDSRMPNRIVLLRLSGHGSRPAARTIISRPS